MRNRWAIDIGKPYKWRWLNDFRLLGVAYMTTNYKKFQKFYGFSFCFLYMEVFVKILSSVGKED